MATIEAELLNLPDQTAPQATSSLPAPLWEALRAAAPIYQQTYWTIDDRGNREWIAMVRPLVERYTTQLTSSLRRAYQTAWPLGPYRVDVTRYSNWAGFYTNVDPIHTVASTRDLRNNTTLASVPNHGTTALEILFHEASHTVVTPGYGTIGTAIENAATALGISEPAGLWHAVIFYTVGRVVADAVLVNEGQHYEMIADSVNVYTDGWSRYRAALISYWEPYLDGKQIPLEDALKGVVSFASARD